MSYQIVYRMIFTNDNNDNIYIQISDTESGLGGVTIIDMQDTDGTELITKCNLKTANDGEDKLYKIRSLRFSCSFVATASFNLSTFITGQDNRWLVEVYVSSISNPPIFTGFLVPDGMKEMFLDEGLYEVELTASDYLPTLSEIPLTKPDGTVPKGHFKLIQYVSWALQKTFLQLPIKVVYSLREQNHTGANDCFFDKIYLEGLSFETNINEREDCATVINKILLGCYITQVNGEWWIVRVDEQDSTPYTIYSFSYDGTFVSKTTGNYLKYIGINDTINLVNEDAAIFPERQIKYAKQSFQFETWQEIICNINYTRGTINGGISIPAGYEAYAPVECWTNAKNPEAATPSPADITGYMRRKVTNGYEEERILVLPFTGSVGIHFFQSETVEVNKLDKFNFSVDRRLTSDHTGSGWSHDSIFKIRLKGNDGSYWAMIGNDAFGKVGSWKQGTGGFPNIGTEYDWVYQTSMEDETQWATHSVEVDPCPVAGKVDIMLLQSDIYGHVNDTHFANIQFEYIPIIDGVYQKVTGQFHKVSNTDNRKANKDEQIYISEAVSPQWKGVLKRFDGTNYLIIGNVYDFRYGTSGGLGLTRFSKYQVFALWNQYNRIIRKFQGSLLGLDTDINELPTMIHKYVFNVSSDATSNKYYQLLGFDMDLATCQWTGTFADVYDSVADKDFTSEWE